MSDVHVVKMTHQRADLILDALQTAADVDPDAAHLYGEIASDLLGTFDADHRDG